MKVANLIIGDINRLTGGYLYQKKLTQYLRGEGIQVDVVSIPDIPYALQFFSNFWLLIYLSRKKYDLIIEDEMIHPAAWLFNIWAKHVKGVKIVAIVHLLNCVALRGTWRAKWVKLIEVLMLKSTHLIIANSKHTMGELEKMGLPDKMVQVIYPGFDTCLVPKRELRLQRGIKLLSVANCEPRKGLDVLVEAIHRLGDAKITLDIVGDESPSPGYVNRIREKIAFWRLEEQIKFRGKVDRQSLGRFYSDADMFVLPSLYEPFGIVLAEAMSYGLPIIATKVGGIPELVEHQKNGLLVAPGDANALAKAIDELASDVKLRQRLGESGYERSNELNTWEGCFKILLEHLQQLNALP
jgi:glycosyltransferase involved in cell wall biosynthesis